MTTRLQLLQGYNYYIDRNDYSEYNDYNNYNDYRDSDLDWEQFSEFVT